MRDEQLQQLRENPPANFGPMPSSNAATSELSPSSITAAEHSVLLVLDQGPYERDGCCLHGLPMLYFCANNLHCLVVLTGRRDLSGERGLIVSMMGNVIIAMLKLCVRFLSCGLM